MSMHKQLIVVAFASAITRSALAQVEEVRLRIDGVTCPSCIINVEKSVQKLKGIDTDAKIQTFLSTGITVIPWSAFQTFDPAPVRSAVKKSGFTLRAIDLTATGALPAAPSVGATTLDLKAPVTAEVFHLVKAEGVDHEQSWKELLGYLADPSNDRQVRVEGRVAANPSASSDEGWNLELTSWAPTEFGAEISLKVKGFRCEKCAARTMRTLGVFDDVIHLEADHESGLVRVWTKSHDPDIDTLCASIADLGFQCTPDDADSKGEAPHDMNGMSKK